MIKIIRNIVSSFFTVLIFSPWVFLAYVGVSQYSKRLDPSDLAIIQDFIGWIGIVYSLLITLILTYVGTQFYTLESTFDRELDALTSLYQAVLRTNTSGKKGVANLNIFKSKIQEDISKYIRHVIETHQTEFRFLQQYRNGQEVLESVANQINSLMLNRYLRIEEMQITELLKCSNDVANSRSFRISHSRRQIQATVNAVAFAITIAWLFPFFGLGIKDPFVTMFLIGVITFVTILILVIISDMSNPFDSAWKINLETWYQFLERIDPNPRFVFVRNIKGTFVDSVLFQLGLKRCKLSSLMRTGFFGISWRNFLNRMKDDMYLQLDRVITCDNLYSDEFETFGYSAYIPNRELPLVILQLGHRCDVLLSAQELNNCRDLKAFESLLTGKME